MGLTAYDVQNIRNNLSEGSEYNPVEVLGALSLYLNFINIFTSLLNLFGERD
jgi:FtsH-binding integral membrane protein